MKAKTALFVLLMVSFVCALSAQSAEELIAEGDALFEQMQDMETALNVLAKYQEAMKIAENKYDAYWKISRIQYYIGEHKKDKKEKRTIFSQGVYWATKAIELEPEKPDGYYWQGVNNGKFGEVKGVLKSLSLVGPIKDAMNKIIELDRTYEDGGADRVLGRVYFKLPGIAGGSKDKSREHLEKSKELGPNDPVTRLYLAETLLKFDEVDQAREELEFILNMEEDDRWVAAVGECKADARELLKDKKFRK
jgi:tetratricopeptide (TPR) repeat protein